MATDTTAQNDTAPLPTIADKLRRRPLPHRASARLSWAGQQARLGLVTDESDGGIGMSIALGAVPPHGAAVRVRFLQGESRPATVRHVAPEGGCVQLGLAWSEES